MIIKLVSSKANFQNALIVKKLNRFSITISDGLGNEIVDGLPSKISYCFTCL